MGNRRLDRVRAARKNLTAAKTEYDEAVDDAIVGGISATRIGEAAGVTEAAIRMKIKRRTSE